MDQPAGKPDTAAASPPPAPPRKLARLPQMRRSLQDRDWVGVAIELAVVVAGILIAFQIDQWGDERERRSEERHLLERLYVENRRAIAELEEVIPQHERAAREIGAALRAEGDPARLALYARTPRFGCSIGNTPYAPYNDTNSQELVTSGRLNLISDPALRDKVRGVVALQVQTSQRAATARSFAGVIVPPTVPYYRFRLAEQPDAMCNIAWPQLMRDHGAKTVVYTAYRIQQTLLRARNETLAAERQLDRVLACKLGKPECRR